MDIRIIDSHCISLDLIAVFTRCGLLILNNDSTFSCSSVDVKIAEDQGLEVS